MQQTMQHLPTSQDIQQAALCIKKYAYKTPLLESSLLNSQLGCRLFVKAENLQRTGSFKFRGAFNKISKIPDNKKKAGIVAYSSGNHAQGVAAVAKLLGIKAQIVMPIDAPAIKIANTKSYGAEVILYDRHKDDREEVSKELIKKNGSILVPPFDDAQIIAGQGTVGLEVAMQAKSINVSLDAFFAPCGGGGLISGCALALKSETPKTELYSAEPCGFDSTANSIKAGKILVGKINERSICDSLLSPVPGKLTYEINSKLLTACLTTNDQAVINAMKIAFKFFKLIIEPGGAAALAAVLSGQYSVAGKTLAVVLSGGNVDEDVYANALSSN